MLRSIMSCQKAGASKASSIAQSYTESKIPRIATASQDLNPLYQGFASESSEACGCNKNSLSGCDIRKAIVAGGAA